MAKQILFDTDARQRILEIPVPQEPRTQVILGSVRAGRTYNRVPGMARLKLEIRSEAPGKAREIRHQIAGAGRPADDALEQSLGLLGVVAHVFGLGPLAQRSHLEVIPQRVDRLVLEPAPTLAAPQEVLDVHGAAGRAEHPALALEPFDALVGVVATRRGGEIELALLVPATCTELVWQILHKAGQHVFAIGR